MDIFHDKQLLKFLKAKQRKTSTEDVYIKELGYYCTYLNKTPTDLINEARSDQLTNAWMDQRKISDYFDNFVDHLQHERQFGDYNIKHVMTIIKMFYNYFEVKTPEKQIKGKLYILLDTMLIWRR